MSTPTITSITPNAGTYSGGTSVTIIGTDFLDGPAPTVTFGGASATSIVVVSATEVTCDTPAGTPSAAVDVVLTNNDAGTVTEVGGFTYEDIAISTITPDDGTYSGGTAITIVGTGFYTGTTVDIDGNPATSVVVVDENTVTCVSPAGSAGAVDVVVTNLDARTDTSVGGFTYEAISVTSLSPNDGIPAGGTAVTITGTGFYTGATVDFDVTPATSVVVVSENSITCVAPAGTGVVDVVVTNLDAQTDTLSGGYSYLIQSSSTVVVTGQLGEAGAGIFRSSPGLGDIMNKIADNLAFIKTASQQDTFGEFKVAMEDVDLLGYTPRKRYGPYAPDTTGDIQVPNRSGEGMVGLNRAQTSEKHVGLKDVLDRIAIMLAELKTASQGADFAAFKAAMANQLVLNKSDDSRI